MFYYSKTQDNGQSPRSKYFSVSMDVVAYPLQISVTKPLHYCKELCNCYSQAMEISVSGGGVDVLKASSFLPAAVFLPNPYWHISTSPN